MANEYQKIQTLFMRDENSIIMPDSLTLPEFEYLKDCKWEATEKIDGTNVHIDVDFWLERCDETSYERTVKWDICGRTERANLPKHLVDHINNVLGEGNGLINAFYEPLMKALDNYEKVFRVSIYGEGYGVKIQKGGNYIKDGVGFIVFDVRVGNYWLKREAIEEIAQKLGFPVVPLIGMMTLTEAIEYVKKGFKSTIAQNPDYDAEGLVLKTPCGLLGRNGQRLITKIKTCDFQKYRAKYGDGPVVQKPNPFYSNGKA